MIVKVKCEMRMKNIGKSFMNMNLKVWKERLKEVLKEVIWNLHYKINSPMKIIIIINYECHVDCMTWLKALRERGVVIVITINVYLSGYYDYDENDESSFRLKRYLQGVEQFY